MRTRRHTNLALLAVAVGAALLVPAAPPARAQVPGDGGAPAVTLPAPGTGTLYWRSPQGLVPLPALTIEAELRVTGILVQGTVRQTFRNTAPTTIEAIYVFPLPKRASVDSFELRVGDRVIRSVVRERAEARTEYETARSEGRKAGLVEFAGRGLFRTSVSGINPGEEVAVTLRYFDEAAWADGTFALALPLTWTPRYTPSAPDAPAGGAGSGPATAPPVSAVDPPAVGGWPTFSCGSPLVPAASPAAPALAVRAILEPGVPLASVRSSSHPVVVASDTTSWTVTTRAGAPADRDFRLEWVPAAGGEARGAVFVEERDDALYALALIVPPAPGSRGDAGIPTRTLFVIDVSGSMEGPSLEQAKMALLAALNGLGPADTFNVLRFSTGSTPFRDTFQPATPSRLGEGRAWVMGLRTDGGTEILAALRHALALMEAEPTRQVQRIVLITDGAVNAGDEAIAAATLGLGEARLHVVGIGPAPNRPLMRALARHGRGACEFIGSPDEVGPRLVVFLDRLRRPVLTDLTLDWDGAPPLDVRPERIPDLYAGQPLSVSLKLDRSFPGTRAVLRGLVASGPFSVDLDIAPGAPRGAGVAARWARARIDDLLDGRATGREEADVRAGVLPLALEFSLVTPYTSLVAVEERPTALGPSVPAPAAGAFPGSAGDLLTLPRGGTLDPLWLRAGLLLLMLGLMLGAVRRFVRE
jgi:Ca-activated chloride channel family protein